MNRLSNAWNDLLIAFGETGVISAAAATVKYLGEVVEGASDQIELATSLWDKWQQNDIGRLYAAQQGTEAEQRMPGRGNQVPGGASAVPRPRANERDVFDDARLLKSQNALQALAKAEEKAQKESLARARNLAKEEEKNHQASLRHTSDLAKAQEDAWRERAERENELARMQNEGLDHTQDLIAEEEQAWQKLGQPAR